MEPLRQAASFEGLIVIAVVYAVMNLLSKLGGKGREVEGERPHPPLPSDPRVTPTQEEGLSLESVLREIERVQGGRAAEPPAPPRPQPSPSRADPAQRTAPTAYAPAKPAAREKAAVRARVVPPRRVDPATSERGPLGRHGRGALEGAEEVEDRTTHDAGAYGREGIEALNESRLRIRPAPPVVDADDQAEAVVERRIREAEARNRPISAADHRAFQARLRQQPQESVQAAAEPRFSAAAIRQAFVWREILGPPKALE